MGVLRSVWVWVWRLEREMRRFQGVGRERLRVSAQDVPPPLDSLLLTVGTLESGMWIIFDGIGYGVIATSCFPFHLIYFAPSWPFAPCLFFF
ncbi:hypothetical protein ACFX2F_019001 [Malus domestica]